jgi:exosortase F-associated protein
MRWLLNHRIDVLYIAVLVFFLAAVRAFEDMLFYDPLLGYYKADFMSRPLPPLDLPKLLLHLFLRYGINALFSLAVLYVIFKKRDIVVFASWLFAAFFAIALLAFIVSIKAFPDDKMLLFYVRRFLIQPLLLLLFIPGFYFQEHAKNNKA